MNKYKKEKTKLKETRKLKDINNKSKKGKNSKNEKKKKHPFLRFLLAIFVILLLAVTSFMTYSVLKNGWGLKGTLQTVLGQSDEKLQDLDPFTVLILGVSKDISVELTDTIMVASYNPKTQKATLLSIPRDTFIGNNKNKATSYDKINALYQKDAEKTLKAVNNLTGLNIKYYIAINNEALIQLVDKIGGVEFDVPIDMKYDDSTQNLHINLKKGYQKLNGEQAEWLVRFRKNNNGTTYPSEYGDNDIGRMKTQREFIKAVAKQTLQFKNITKLKSLMTIFKENVKSNITDWDTISAYIPYAVEFNTENMRAETLPGTTDKYNNLWFFIASKKATTKLIDELITEQNGTEENETDELNNNTIDNNVINNTMGKDSTNNTSKNTSSTNNINNTKNSKINVEILNGTGDSKILTEVTNKLKNKGYNIYKTGTTSLSPKTTIINKTDVDGEIPTEIKKLLGVAIISKSQSNSSNKVDITIVIGKDYKDN